MTTSNKNFKVKNGLEVLGTSATVDGNEVLTTASAINDLADVSTTGAQQGQALVFDSSLNLIPGTVSGGGGGASGVITSDTKPSPATDGLEWHDTTDGTDYISVDGVWVGRSAPATVSSATDVRLTNAEANIVDLEQQVRPVILGGTGATTAAGARTNLDAAQTAHVHSASDITSGVLSVQRGGTGFLTGSGLVPIKPTSVTTNAGTVSVNSFGKITMTGASNIFVDGAFSSLFRNYVVIFNYNYGTAAAWTSFRWRSSGVEAAGSIYDSQYNYQGTNSLPSLARFTNETSGRWFPEAGYKTTWEMKLYSPYEALYTVAQTTGSYINTDNSVEFGMTHSLHKANIAYDGFSFYSSANKNGTIQIFGVAE